MAATRTVFVISTLWLLFLMGSAGLSMAETPSGTVYGDGVTLEQATPITSLLTNAKQYDGKKVRIDGVVTAVCERRGCWMQLADPESGDSIRIKVTDGAIVFPVSAKGHKASAEGTFQVITLTEEQRAARQAKKEGCKGEGCAHEGEAGHDCKHKGESGHDCQHKGEPGHNCQGHGAGMAAGSDTVYLIRGTGAVVY